MVNPAASVLFPSPFILFLLWKHSFPPPLQAREVGQCLAMEVDSVALRMKQRITSIPEMQHLSKEVGQLTKVRITSCTEKSQHGLYTFEAHGFFPTKFTSYYGQ